MDLTNLSDGIQKRKAKKRVGRGIGSGHGKTASRGHKGQYASAGSNKQGQLFVGGQTPLHRRFPKRGFSNARFAKQCAIVNIGDLNAFDDGATVDMAALKEKRLVTGTWDGLRVLGEGELTRKLSVTADHFTAKAKAAIEGKGGTCTVVVGPKPPVRNKMKAPKPKVAKKK
jgi:large subunit ribosomal protein L15